MREVQDLTIQRMSGAARVDQLLTERSDLFRQWIAVSPTHNCVTTGCRITLVPTSDIYVPSLYRNAAFLPPIHTFQVQFENGGGLEALVPANAYDERPILRGTRRSDDINTPKVIQEAHCAGLIELTYRQSQEEPQFFESWILGVYCNGLLMADAFRCAAGAPELEYIFELELSTTSSTIPIASSDHHRLNRPLGTSPTNPCLFPRMSLGNFTGEINRLVEIGITDISNCCGVPFAEKVKMVSWAQR